MGVRFITSEQYLKKSTKTIYNTQTRHEVYQELKSCIAQEDFDFRGKVMIGIESEKVQIKKGQYAKKGMPLIVSGIDGFTLIVEKE